MVIYPVRYEGFGRIQSHSWDQAYARSPEKNVGLISGILYRSSSVQVQHAKFQEGICSLQNWKSLSSNQRPKTNAEIERMREISYASAVGSLMYAML